MAQAAGKILLHPEASLEMSGHIPDFQMYMGFTYPSIKASGVYVVAFRPKDFKVFFKLKIKKWNRSTDGRADWTAADWDSKCSWWPKETFGVHLKFDDNKKRWYCTCCMKSEDDQFDYFS